MSKPPAGKSGGSSEVRSTDRRLVERRLQPRFPFTASVEAIEPKSHAKLSGRTSDLCLGGCYVDTISPFAAGTAIKIRLTKEKVTFDADARVIFSHIGMGMGVAFISATPRQIRIFQHWLNELSGKSLPELEPPKEPEVDVDMANLTKDRSFVLAELLVALMKKGVLNGEEGKAMLQMLRNCGTR